MAGNLTIAARLANEVWDRTTRYKSYCSLALHLWTVTEEDPCREDEETRRRESPSQATRTTISEEEKEESGLQMKPSGVSML